MRTFEIGAVAVAASTFALPLMAERDQAHALFTNVHVLAGQNEALTENADIVVAGNTICRPKVTLQNT